MADSTNELLGWPLFPDEIVALMSCVNINDNITQPASIHKILSILFLI